MSAILKAMYKNDLLMSAGGVRPSQENYVRTLLMSDKWLVTYWCGEKLDQDDCSIEGYLVGRVDETVNYFYDCGNEKLYRCFEEVHLMGRLCEELRHYEFKEPTTDEMAQHFFSLCESALTC